MEREYSSAVRHRCGIGLPLYLMLGQPGGSGKTMFANRMSPCSTIIVSPGLTYHVRGGPFNIYTDARKAF